MSWASADGGVLAYIPKGIRIKDMAWAIDEEGVDGNSVSRNVLLSASELTSPLTPNVTRAGTKLPSLPGGLSWSVMMKTRLLPVTRLPLVVSTSRKSQGPSQYPRLTHHGRGKGMHAAHPQG